VHNSGWCSVQWPSGYQNGYRIGASGRFDLLYASPRDGFATSSLSSSQSTVQAIKNHVTSLDARPGLLVQRGIDWQWGDQDGSTIGVIVSIERNGWANVRWETGTVNGYRIGAGGKFDLQASNARVRAYARDGKLRPKPASTGNAPTQNVVHKQLQSMYHNGRNAPCNHRPRRKCWCIDQFGDILPLL